MSGIALPPVSILEAIVLGLVQGLTEFLPISSSAHVGVVGGLMGTSPGATFTAIVQLGTEAAVLLYFRRDIARIISHWAKSLPVGPWAKQVPSDDPDARMGWYVIVGSVPIVVLGFLLESLIEGPFRNLWVTVAMLTIFGLLLGWADKVGEKRKTLRELTWREGLLFGGAQALALVPGVSRSGGTITAGLLMGYTREAAARYSFLLAIPAVVGSGLYQLVTADGTSGDAGAAATIVATLIAFAVGYVVIIGFLKIVSTYSYRPFVYYRLGLAAVLAVLLLTGVLDVTAAG